MARTAMILGTMVLAVLAGGCGAAVGGAGGSSGREVDGAVDHVQQVLAAAGHPTPAITGLVFYDCGPADELYGIRVVDEPVVLDVPWTDVEPVLERTEVAGDGWTVRWAASADAATEVTVVGGGDVGGESVERWREAGFLDVWPCG